MIKIEQNVQLKPFTSWQIGGYAEYFCLPQNRDELHQALNWAQQKNLIVTILGGGSNVLIADSKINGLIIGMKSLSKVEEISEDSERLYIVAESGCKKSELLKIFLKYELSPALFLAGIPGQIGGGVVMNAGIGDPYSPREFSEIIDWIEVLQSSQDSADHHSQIGIGSSSTSTATQIGNFSKQKSPKSPPESISHRIVRYEKEQIQWNYRHTSGWQPGVIIRVGISWPLQKIPGLLSKVKEVNHMRAQKQPIEWPTGGSVFVNPPNEKAARLIDSCGLKGCTIGGAQVSTKHANFIINLGTATAEDVWRLIKKVQVEVYEQTQILLQTEIITIGSFLKN